MRTLTLLLLALVLVVGATTVTFQPGPAVGKDAKCIFSLNFMDTNFGSDPDLCFGAYREGDGFSRSFIEFTELNDSQYQGATVASASLWLYCCYTISRDSRYHRLGLISTEWNESAITARNCPGVSEHLSFPIPECESCWLEFDVTDYVQSWLDGTQQNYGFVFYGTGGEDLIVTCSSDGSDSTLRPKLVLEYYGAAVEEATWGEIKADF